MRTQHPDYAANNNHAAATAAEPASIEAMMASRQAEIDRIGKQLVDLQNLCKRQMTLQAELVVLRQAKAELDRLENGEIIDPEWMVVKDGAAKEPAH
jgi:hypothetical protein